MKMKVLIILIMEVNIICSSIILHIQKEVELKNMKKILILIKIIVSIKEPILKKININDHITTKTINSIMMIMKAMIMTYTLKIWMHPVEDSQQQKKQVMVEM